MNKSHVVSVRLSDDDLAKLRAKAAEQDCTLSEAIRRCAMWALMEIDRNMKPKPPYTLGSGGDIRPYSQDRTWTFNGYRAS